MSSNRTSRNRRCRDHGMALVIVLGSAALFAVLAAMMIASAQTSRIVTKVNTERSQMKYAAESALAYGQWMIMSDRRRFPNRRLGFRDIQREAVDTESWMGDGKPHDVWVTDGILAHVRVLDAARGWDFKVCNVDCAELGALEALPIEFSASTPAGGAEAELAVCE
ncbi:MAG: hypothetical protein QF541_06675, partial [Lentisphaeria bacterium]|nr:hypothetical protein [Lentisphaeria bacterium]